MRFFILLFFFLTYFLYSSNLIVASASNLSFVLPKIIKDFKSKYGCNVNLIFASSGVLSNQILHKAPFDIFLSADFKHPLLIYKRGYAINYPKVYANGKLVVVSKLKGENLIDILKKANLVAIANPKIAPYGKAAYEVLNNLHIKPKLIYSNSVSGVANYFFTIADVGFISKSLIYSQKFKNYRVLNINENLYSPIKQGVVMLNNKKCTKEFFNYILSNRAKKVFKSYGYR